VSPSNVTVPDPDAEYTWGLQQIGVPSFDEQFDVRGEGANVTIIDDGISDGDHPDLEFAQKVNIVDNEINVGAIGLTDDAHGEHVAGTATGALDPAGDVPRYGVAPNASLTKINVFEGTPGASFANILTAVDYAVTERNADVAGMSLSAGGPVSTVFDLVDQQMRDAKAAGTLVTVSSGNAGTSSRTAMRVLR
jgi:Subtilase family.